MNEEKKTYSVVGTVTIGTDEYRDLITEVAELKGDLKEVEKRKSDLYWENDKNKRKAEELEKSLETYKAYVADGHQDSFKLWKLEQMEGESEE